MPGRTVEVGRLTSPRSTETVSAPGDLVVELGGQEHTLVVLESVPGLRLAVFTDPSSGTDTPEIGRWLIVPQGEGSTVRVDFNQVTLPHHAFSTAFPCPIPLEANHLPVVVDAGERALVLDGTSRSTMPEPDNRGQDGIMEPELTEKAVQYLRHLERFDFASMRAMCTDMATVWHNDGKGEQTIEENLGQLKQMSSGGGCRRVAVRDHPSVPEARRGAPAACAAYQHARRGWHRTARGDVLRFPGRAYRPHRGVREHDAAQREQSELIQCCGSPAPGNERRPGAGSLSALVLAAAGGPMRHPKSSAQLHDVDLVRHPAVRRSVLI